MRPLPIEIAGYAGAAIRYTGPLPGGAAAGRRADVAVELDVGRVYVPRDPPSEACTMSLDALFNRATAGSGAAAVKARGDVCEWVAVAVAAVCGMMRRRVGRALGVFLWCRRAPPDAVQCA
jgi:DNA-binding helix-hairpin-helix protein with protein kinase domain